MLSAQFTDDFSDGDFTYNPEWTGETEKFAVTAGELELEGPAVTGEAYLITSSSVTQNAVWEFYHIYKGNPSNGNHGEFFLMADQPNLSSAVNGYSLQIGQSGSDDFLTLYRNDGSQRTDLLSTSDGSALNSNNEISIRIRVTRDDIGNWEVFADKEGGTDYISLGTINDNTYYSASFSGVKVAYTSTKNEGFYFFDNFKVQVEASVDTVAPTLQQLEVLSSNSISLKFSESLEQVTAEDETNFIVNNGINFPSSALLQNGNTVVLTFSSPFTSGQENEVIITGISDIEGNVANSMVEPFTYNEIFIAGFNEVMITEIHAAPNESTSLPSVEFIEIFNPTNTAFNLENWTYQDGSYSSKTFAAATLNPEAYAIVCDADDVSLFESFGQVIAINGTLSLNNPGDDLSLRNEFGELVFHIAYDDDWYRDILKADGGWSLEMKDVNLPCLGASNWRASTDPSGGTPGKENSVNETLSDEMGIEIVEVEVEDSNNITVILSEKANIEALDDLVINIDNGIGEITAYEIIEPQLVQISIQLSQPLEENIVYTITIEQLFDCENNIIGTVNNWQFGLPEMVELGDLVINEILFNPIAGGVDFVELYNKSDKLLSTKDLIIAKADPFMPDSIMKFDNLSDSRKLIFPNDFIVFSQDPDNIKQEFYTLSPNKFLQTSSSVNFDAKEGVVVIFRSDLTKLDQLIYSEDWHFALLDNIDSKGKGDGVSLERISIYQPTQDQNNWHSASQNVGWATPTYLNSSTTEIVGNDEISISPEIISPNSDGFDDFTIISYNFSDVDFVANIRIFDAHGRLVNHLVKNETTGLEGFYKWDATDEDGEKVRTGIYIVLVDIFDLDGNGKKFKREVAVSLK